MHENPLRPLNDRLEDLPFPDRSIFRPLRLLPRWFMVGRGCPYRCTYCFNRAYNDLYGVKKPSIRRRPVDNIIAELRELKNSGEAFAMQSVDDVFCHPPVEWLEEFSVKYAREIGLPIGGNVRANLVTEPVVRSLKEAGFFAVGMGVEAGNEELRQKVLGRHMSDASIVKAGRLLREAGIHVTTYNIVGIPGGSVEADIETIRLNRALRPWQAISFILGPYRGTKIYDTACEMGMIGDDYVDELKESSRHVYGWHPRLKYANPQEALRVENVHSLFSIAVKAPFVYRCLPWLVNRRLTKTYSVLAALFFRLTLLAQLLKLLGDLRRRGMLGRFVRKVLIPGRRKETLAHA